MSRAILSALLLTGLVSVVPAQHVEDIIFLPDSIIGIRDPRCGVQAENGASYLVGGTDGWLVRVDCATHAKAGRVFVDSGVRVMCTNSNGSRVYAGHSYDYPRTDSLLSIVDPAGMTVVRQIPVGLNPVAMVYGARHGLLYCLCRESAGLAMVCGNGDTLVGQTTVRPYPVGAVFSEPTDRLFVWHWQDEYMSIVDGATGQMTDSLLVGQYPSAALLNPEGTRLYVGYGDKLAVFECSTGARIAELGIGRFPTSLAYVPGQNRLFCALTASDVVAVVDCNTNQLIGTIGVGDSPRHLAWDSVHGRVVCTNYLGRSVSLIDPAALTVAATVWVRRYPAALVVNAVSGVSYVVHETNAGVSVVDGGSGTLLTSIMLAEQPKMLCWNRGMRRLLCLTAQSRVYAIDGASNQVLYGIDVGDGPTGLEADSASNKFYVSDYYDSTVAVYDIADGHLLTRIRVGANPAAMGYNSIDRKVYCCRTGRVQIIDPNTDSIRGGISSVGRGTNVLFNRWEDKVYIIDGNTGAVVIVNGATNGVLGTVRAGEDPTNLGFNPYNGEGYCTYPARRSIAVIGDSSNSLEDTMFVPGNPSAVCGNGVNGRIYVSDRTQGMLYVFDPASHDMVDSIPGVGNVRCLFWNYCDSLIYASDRAGDRVLVVDPRMNVVVETLAVEPGPGGMAHDAVQNRVYVLNEAGGAIAVIAGLAAVGEGRNLEPAGPLAIRPNPARHRAELLLGVPVAGPVSVRLVDVCGRVARAYEVGAEPGRSSVRLDLRGLAPGVYVAQVRAGCHRASARLVVPE